MTWPWKKKAPPVCVECKWFNGVGYCFRVGAGGFNVIYGNRAPAYAFNARRSGACGPSGKLFEPKD